MATSIYQVSALTISGEFTNEQFVGSYIDCTGLTFTITYTSSKLGTESISGESFSNGSYSYNRDGTITITASPALFSSAGIQDVVFTATGVSPSSIATATKSVTVQTSGYHGDGTIAGTITAMSSALTAVYSTISAKGGTVPSSKTFNALPVAIQAIPALSVQSKTITLTSNTTSAITPDSGYKLSAVNIVTSVSSPDIAQYTKTIDRTVTSFSDSVITSIGSCAFYSCSNLSTISFPNCTSIGESVFYYCTSLTAAVFPNCTSIGASAFGYCRILTTISFPSCTDIGNHAFYYCSNLTTVSFPVCSYIGTGAFFYCSNLTTISFPACKNIAGNAFNGCSYLTIASFPVCTYIGSNAFQGCLGLSIVSVPNCTYIGSAAFQSCCSLSIASFPVCTYIGSNAFQGCLGLSIVSFSVCSYIGNYAFYNNENLSALYILSSICSLGNSNAFSGTLLKTTGSIYVPSSRVDYYKTSTNWTYFSSRIFAYTG